MKATKNLAPSPFAILFASVLCLLVGCTPPGPAALLDGESLLEEGEYQAAIKKLKVATELMGDHPEAWNFLGLAYHRAGELESAVKAYKKALDLNVDLQAARYNFGSLLLENGEFEAAEDQFKTYEIMAEDEPEIRVKIGAAQLGDGRMDEAEASFQKALRHSRAYPEAWNGLGLIQLHRDLAQSAERHFKAAIEQDQNYAPAYLNQAIVAHRYFNDLPRALQHYRRYMFLEPNAPNVPEITALTAEIEVAMRPIPKEVVVPPAEPVEQEPDPVAEVTQVAETPPVQEDKPTEPAEEEKAEPDEPVVVARNEGAEPEIEAVEVVTEIRQNEESESAEAENAMESTTLVKVETPLKETLSPVREPESDPPGESLASKVTFETVEVADPQYEFAVAKDQPENTTPGDATNEGWRTVSTRRSGLGISVGRRMFQSPEGQATGAQAVRTGRVQRQANVSYNYRNPRVPNAGDRLGANPFFLQGNAAFKAGRESDAILAYREAVSRDPAFFAAHFNMGLAAIRSGLTDTALDSYETALALDPSSRNARYNFALALEQGKHFETASTELSRLLSDHPNDVNAHFTLATLFAKKIGDAALARQHYLEVLRLDPNYPEAVSIRYWLSADD